MEPTSKESGKRSETPQKLLEDLFRKTKAFPFLYWLPLTEEQIIEKEKHKVIVERERQERIARREAEPKRENISPNRPPPQHMASYSFKLTLIITNNIVYYSNSNVNVIKSFKTIVVDRFHHNEVENDHCRHRLDISLAILDLVHLIVVVFLHVEGDKWSTSDDQ